MEQDDPTSRRFPVWRIDDPDPRPLRIASPVALPDVPAGQDHPIANVVAVVVRQEIVLAIMGGVFVVETVSVIIQVASFKLTGKRVFRMAPLHHHFELKGWAEPKVIVRFWIITVILVLIGLASLKIR